MKIMICSSMKFAKEILDTKEKLENLGHDVSIPLDTNIILDNSHLTDDLDADLKHVTESNILKRCFDLIASADAILVLNYPKNGVDGYIGTSIIMEIGLAYYLDKTIFLLHPVPDYHDHRWAHEVQFTRPIIINDDLDKISANIS